MEVSSCLYKFRDDSFTTNWVLMKIEGKKQSSTSRVKNTGEKLNLYNCLLTEILLISKFEDTFRACLYGGEFPDGAR